MAPFDAPRNGVTTPPDPAAVRGEMIDIGGRRLRAVRAGPRASTRPLVVLECGAFGCAADWAVVQERLAAKGFRSLAYDRAGLGYSDPGPKPRNAAAFVRDLARLLASAGEPGPFVLAGHSMGGLYVRLFAHEHPDKVVGVVLVDAVVPEAMDVRAYERAAHAYRRAMRLVGMTADLGYMRPAALVLGNLIGLTGEAAKEKRRIYGSAVHARWSAEEVQHWMESCRLAGAATFRPGLPVAVVTAGAEERARGLKALQAEPAQASRAGYVEHVAGSNHASLLGRRFGDPIVRGIEHVVRAAGA